MTQNVQFHLNNDETIEVCNKLGVVQEDLGKSLKAMVLDNKVTKVYPTRFAQEIIEDYKKDNVKAPEDRVTEFSEKELREILGITKRNEKNKIRQHGLYMKNNLEEAMLNFTAHWNGDIYKVREIVHELKDIEKREFAVRELLRRGYKVD